MKEQALEILLRYIDNTKEANDALSELLVLFDVSNCASLEREVNSRHLSDVISSHENKETRPLKFGELCLILARFKIMLEEEPNRYTIEEFIQQEDFRRAMFS